MGPDECGYQCPECRRFFVFWRPEDRAYKCHLGGCPSLEWYPPLPPGKSWYTQEWINAHHAIATGRPLVARPGLRADAFAAGVVEECQRAHQRYGTDYRYPEGLPRPAKKRRKG